MAWTGYLPILLFRHMAGRTIFFVRQSIGLLYHRHVTIFDLLMARCLCEILSNLAALVASGVLLYLLGAIDAPKNWPLFFLGYFYMIWWSIAVALIMGPLSERNDIVEKIWAPLSYMYLPISGFFYMASWLPDRIRELALTFVPPLHCYEMIRAGLFGNVMPFYYDQVYLAKILAVLTVMGFLIVRDAGDYIYVE
jgi:capsular polysaccharide transport system permease protein